MTKCNYFIKIKNQPEEIGKEKMKKDQPHRKNSGNDSNTSKS